MRPTSGGFSSGSGVRLVISTSVFGDIQKKRQTRIAIPLVDVSTPKWRRKRMKRRDFLKAGGVGLVATAGVAAPAIAQSNPEVKWRMTASWPKALDTLYGGCGNFAKQGVRTTHTTI